MINDQGKGPVEIEKKNSEALLQEKKISKGLPQEKNKSQQKAFPKKK